MRGDWQGEYDYAMSNLMNDKRWGRPARGLTREDVATAYAMARQMDVGTPFTFWVWATKVGLIRPSPAFPADTKRRKTLPKEKANE